MYLNPSFNEVAVLKAANPDTLRIIADDDEVNFAVANGYGATHTCIMRKFRIEGGDLIFDCRKKLLISIGTSEDTVISYGAYGDNLKQFLDDFLSL